MSSETLHIFDPRRNFQLHGFAGRACDRYDPLHGDRVSMSGIFQAAEDFAVLGW